MKSWALGAMVVSMFAVTACGAKGTSGTTTGDSAGGSGGTGSNTTGSNTTGSNTTGSNTTGAGGGTGCASTGQDFQIPACNDCLAMSCCAEQTTCDTGTECDATFVCLAKCGSGDMACTTACADASQQGATDYNALITCLQNICQTECTQGGKICDSGLATPKKPECGDCLGMICCTEYDACTADPACKACLLSPMAAGCDMNALAKSATDCGAAKCKMQCAQ
jgi:hypothetical protein